MFLQAKSFRSLPSLLICADLQRDEVSPDMPGRCDDTLDKCALLLARWRENHWPVVHLKRIARASWFEASRSRSDWVSGFRPMPGELVFEHALPSAYSSSRFTEYMRNVRPEISILAGLSLDQTILSSAIDGFHRGYRHYVVTDAVDSIRQSPAVRDTLMSVLGFYSSRIDASGLMGSGERAARTGGIANEK